MLNAMWISIDDAILARSSSVAAVQSGARLLSAMTPHSREKAAARCPRVSGGGGVVQRLETAE